MRMGPVTVSPHDAQVLLDTDRIAGRSNLLAELRDSMFQKKSTQQS